MGLQSVVENKDRKNMRKRTFENFNQEFKFKALLVEDDKQNRLVASKMLRIFQVEVEEASDGEMAIEKIKENEFDCILMDVTMPRKDGIETTKEIRRIEKLKSRIPSFIVAFTSNVTEKDKKKCLEYGMDYFLGKPVTLSQIKDVLLRVKLRKDENIKM